LNFRKTRYKALACRPGRVSSFSGGSRRSCYGEAKGACGLCPQLGCRRQSCRWGYGGEAPQKLDCWSIIAFCVLVKPFTSIPKCIMYNHMILKLRTRNLLCLQGCVSAMLLISVPIYGSSVVTGGQMGQLPPPHNRHQTRSWDS